MQSDKRLTECYQKALADKDIIKVTENTRMVFFSDVHRGDNSLADEFAHNQTIFAYALEYYNKLGYHYLELGDGDELWEYKKFSLIRSAHSDIFYLLKKFYDDSRFTYFYGNHNMMFRNPNKAKELHQFYDDYQDIETSLFPGIKIYESMVLKDEKSQKEVLLVHGHQGDTTNDKLWFVSSILVRYFWRNMHVIGLKNPASPSKNRVKRHKIEKRYTKWIQNHGVAILCGHTHRPKLPDAGTPPYMNTGCCIHPRGITGIELINREFYLVNWYIKGDDFGQLIITRKIVKGPLKFEDL